MHGQSNWILRGRRRLSFGCLAGSEVTFTGSKSFTRANGKMLRRKPKKVGTFVTRDPPPPRECRGTTGDLSERRRKLPTDNIDVLAGGKKNPTQKK